MQIAIMDGRARFDTDRAIVVECCDSLKEAIREMRKTYRHMDYVVVDIDTDEILFDPELGDTPCSTK